MVTCRSLMSLQKQVDFPQNFDIEKSHKHKLCQVSIVGVISPFCSCSLWLSVFHTHTHTHTHTPGLHRGRSWVCVGCLCCLEIKKGVVVSLASLGWREPRQDSKVQPTSATTPKHSWFKSNCVIVSYDHVGSPSSLKLAVLLFCVHRFMEITC